eukprot:gb/GEZN01023510.1/.p1 GENE.gb/GEZN01023510.1/~~gb/GEZN01023510.1/.p1  ORF type:complete len:184 (+),score=23.27 gb/GEZN01023510.1/:26-553(+)
MPIGWGEIIPLSFISPLLATVPVLYWSMPTRRYDEVVKMVPQLQANGAQLFHFLDGLNQSVAVLISADLAHTFQASGPYGFSYAAKPFDLLCLEWARTMDSDVITRQAALLVNEAKSCGYAGLVMLDALLQEAARMLGVTVREAWKNQLLASAHPTYYGMMVASFRPTFASSTQL